MLKFMFMGDYELTRDRLPIARPILESAASLFESEKCDVFIGTGDYIDEFEPDVVHYFRELMIDGFGVDKHLLIGNHDYNVPGIDRMNAIFDNNDWAGSGGVHIVSYPMVKTFSHPSDDKGNAVETAVAFLPAPNRAMFGANRIPENQIERNKALTAALGNAVKALGMEFGKTRRIITEPDMMPISPAESIFVAHGTPAGAVFPTGKRSHGLTWEIPTDTVRTFGKALFGHIHRPYEMDHGRIVGVGGIAPWTHGDRDAQYYAVIVTVHADNRIEHMFVPLLRQLFPVELFVRESGVYWEYDNMSGMSIQGMPDISNGLSFGGVDYLDADNFASGIIKIATEQLPYSWRPADTIALKIRFQLPHAMMSTLPSDGEIRTAIMAHISQAPTGIHKITIARERTDTAVAARIAGDRESMTMDAMFREWMLATGNTIESEAFERANDFIRDIDAADMFADGNFGIEPIRLTFRNFRQWENAEIDFADWNGAVAITGKNALGKSNLVESMLFALYKHTPSSSGLIADEINNNTTDAAVEFEFRAGGAQYKVSRALKRTKKGATCKTEFVERRIVADDIVAGGVIADSPDAPKWMPVAETAGDIDKAIAEIVGSYPFVISTFFGTQKDIDRLIDATPTEMHELMLESLALHRFEQFRDDAANRSRAIADEHDSLTTAIAAADELIDRTREKLEPYESADVYDAEIANAEKANETFKFDRDTERLNAVEQRAIRDAAMIKRADKAAFERALADYKSTVKKADKEIMEMERQHAADAPTLPPVPVSQLTIDRGETNDALHNSHFESNDIGRQQKSAIATHTAAVGTVNTTAGRIAAIDRDIAVMDVGGYPDVPCDEPDFSGPPNAGDRNIKSRCPAYRIMTAAGRRESYVAERDKAAAGLANAQTEMAVAKFAVDTLEKQGNAIERDVVAASDALREIDVQIATATAAEKAILNHAAMAGEIEKALSTRNEYADRAVSLAFKIKKCGDPETAIATCDAAIAAANEKAEMADNQLAESNQLIRAVGETRSTVKALADTIADTETIRNTNADTAKRIAGDVHAWTLLVDAFSKNGGIPYLIMEKTVGGIAAETNRLLDVCGSGITIEIATQTETQAGDARDRVDIRFNDERGNHPLASASGYQRAVIGMSLRAAFSRIGSEFWGLTPAFFVQDEGWDRFHASARPIAGALIAELADTFKTFVFITHIVSLGDYADTRIDVTGENGISTFKRIA